MDKKERKKLIKELTKRLEKAKSNQSKYGTYSEDTLLRHGTTFNPKYLSQEEKNLLVTLRKFMRDNPDLARHEILDILISDIKKFGFIIDCYKKYNNFFELLENRVGYLMNKIAVERRNSEKWRKHLS